MSSFFVTEPPNIPLNISSDGVIPWHDPPYKMGQRVALLDLAPELITLVGMSSEDWRIVFALKKVCRTLNITLNDRSIWVHLVSTCLYSPSRLPRHLFVDRPISAYSVSELEALFIRWKKVERGWKCADQKFNFSRLSLPMGTIRHSRVLTPGGRWLILFSSDLSASYIDLDSFTAMKPETPNLVALIPAHGPYESTALRVSEPDVDQASPVISFRIALTYGRDLPEGPSFVEIWNITSLYDSDAKTSRLDAQKVAALQLDLACGRLNIYSLAGESILLAAPHVDLRAARIFIYLNWRKAMDNPHQPCYRIVLLPARTRGATFIGEDKLLVSTHLGIQLVNCQDIRKRSISDCRQYHLPASLSNINYGTETIISSQVFFYMSHVYCHDTQSAGQTKSIFLADKQGRLAVVTYQLCGGAATTTDPRFASAGLISLEKVKSILFGPNLVVFAPFGQGLPSRTMTVRDAFLATQNDDVKLTPHMSLQTACNPTSFNINLSLDIFDEGIGRILTHHFMAGDFHIEDMIV